MIKIILNDAANYYTGKKGSIGIEAYLLFSRDKANKIGAQHCYSSYDALV